MYKERFTACNAYSTDVPVFTWLVVIINKSTDPSPPPPYFCRLHIVHYLTRRTHGQAKMDFGPFVGSSESPLAMVPHSRLGAESNAVFPCTGRSWNLSDGKLPELNRLFSAAFVYADTRSCETRLIFDIFVSFHFRFEMFVPRVETRPEPARRVVRRQQSFFHSQCRYLWCFE